MIRDLVIKNRSYRKFRQGLIIELKTLRELVDLARLSSSSANMQPLKYILSCDAKKNTLIFPHLGWAGYLKDWAGPNEGERPLAYIIILGDKKVAQNFAYDCGIAAQTILLGATELGLGGCMIGTLKQRELGEVLKIPEQYEILLVLALGKPKEKVVLEKVGPCGDIKYWRDNKDVHHVPKRALSEIIHKEFGK